ncbi:MAG: radical SAM protein [Candidatus Omnitrophota bacterium]
MNIAIISFQDNADIIGAKYIHAYLKVNNHKSYLILQSQKDGGTDDLILRFIADNGIQLVGISLMSNEFFRAKQFAEKFKLRFQSMPLVFGGIHATIAPEECLEIGDIVVRGEGEHVFLDLLCCIDEGRDYSGLDGIAVKHGGRIKLNPPRALETDIDRFPFPKHLPQDMYAVHQGAVRLVNEALFKVVSRYNGTFPNIITSRGCPFSCAYCCNSALKGLYGHYPVRKRSVEAVMAEIIEMAAEHKNCLSLNIQDDCFLTYSEGWISDFSDKYRREVGLPFVIRTSPRHVSREKLVLLKEAGLMMLMMGLQSGSDRVNRDVFKRNITSDDFLSATRIVKSLGLVAYYDIILDTPYETEEDVLKTLDIILQVPKPFQLQLFSLCLYQGTELHERARKDGVAFIDPRKDDYWRLSSTTLNKLIQLSPTVPDFMIKYFIRHRTNVGVRGLIDGVVLFNTLVLTPLSFLGLMHRAYGSNLLTTLRVIRNFFGAALRKMLNKSE